MISGSQTKHIFFFTFLFYLIFFKFNFRGRTSRLLVISCLFVHPFFLSLHLSQTVFRRVYCFTVVLPSVLPTATHPIFFVSYSISVKDFSRNTAGRVYRSITKIGYYKMYRVKESSLLIIPFVCPLFLSIQLPLFKISQESRQVGY